MHLEMPSRKCRPFCTGAKGFGDYCEVDFEKKSLRPFSGGKIVHIVISPVFFHFALLSRNVEFG